MTLFTIALYGVLVVAVIYKRVQGRPVDSVKSLFALPIVLAVLGYTDLHHTHLNTVDVVVTVAGCGLSLALGAVRGWVDKLSVHDGRPWMRWGVASIVVLVVNVAAKLAVDVAGVAAGGTSSGVTSSLLLALGLMLVGESAVVWLRLQSGANRLGTADRFEVDRP